MKKVVFFVLGLVVLVFAFSLGRVSAKNGWDCLYGECDKKSFVVLKSGKEFFIGNITNKTVNNGFFVTENTQGGDFYIQKKAYVKMSTDSIAFGHIGENSNKKACIAKGYVFKLDLSSYDKYADKDCKPLSGSK